jgi:transposase
MGYAPKWYDNSVWLRSSYIDKGMKIPEIAEFAGVSEETIRKLLIKYKIKRSG